MLTQIAIRNFTIVDQLDLDFTKGMTVLTGETGAGKSLLVESLKLLGGQRAQSDMVRTGDDRLWVEGVFTNEPDSPLAAILDDLGIPRSDAVVLRLVATRLLVAD